MMMTTTKTIRMAALALVALAALLLLRWPRSGAPAFVSASGAAAKPAEAYRWPGLEAGVWNRFRSGEPVAPRSSAGSLASRYRLAGVFLVLADPENPGNETRCAILDDLQAKEQVLAGEDEWMGNVRVVRVAADHVVLSDGEKEETVVLAAGTLPGQRRGGPATAPAGPPAQILETTRFGNRVGDTRWEVSRQSVLDYYQEMMDNPERLANLFLAMKAVRDDEGKVAGYRLDMDVGEKEFYSEVGFENGDIVRKVNSMRMTSQRRAEYFIGEFVQDRLGAVVIDIERNGEPKKLVYLVK